MSEALLSLGADSEIHLMWVNERVRSYRKKQKVGLVRPTLSLHHLKSQRELQSIRGSETEPKFMWTHCSTFFFKKTAGSIVHSAEMKTIPCRLGSFSAGFGTASTCRWGSKWRAPSLSWFTKPNWFLHMPFFQSARSKGGTPKAPAASVSCQMVRTELIEINAKNGSDHSYPPKAARVTEIKCVYAHRCATSASWNNCDSESCFPTREFISRCVRSLSLTHTAVTDVGPE